MEEQRGVCVKVSHQFPQPAGRVFDAWLDPGLTARWLFATPTGVIVECSIEAWVGGRFRIVDRRDGEDVAHTGDYLEIERPSRLVFTFSVPKYSSAVSRVSIDIAPVSNGCALTLTNDDVPPEFADGSRKGWGDLLAGLERALSA